MQEPSTHSDYERLDGAVPLLYPPGLEERALELRGILETGSRELSSLLGMEPPALQALLVADEDWREAPRESVRPYPPGLLYFTRATLPPVLVLPERLSPAFGPRTEATLPLTVWHELAHAFLLREETVRTPPWLREFVPQAAAAAVARRTGTPLEEHLSRAEAEAGFDVRAFGGPADAGRQMAFQNALLALGNDALEEFGEEFLGRLVRALWDEESVVNGRRAEELLADSLGDGGREWLASRPEFREG
ncbi:MAG: hypothetical protein M3157_04175 [Actinomycetota bacterium]|nr:hypothetical protein [Actinomycetota bacterium]